MAPDANHGSPAPPNGASISRLKSFDPHAPASMGTPITLEAISKAAASVPEAHLDEKKKEKIAQWVQKKAAITPGKVYHALFDNQRRSAEQVLRHALGSTPKFAPQAVIGLLQKKVKGAKTRIDNRREELRRYRVALKTGILESNGRVQRLTPESRKALQQKKLQAEAALYRVVGEWGLYRAQLEEAVAMNVAPLREAIKSVRESVYAKRMTPSISKKIIDEAQKETSVKEDFLKLKEEQEGGPIADRFLEAVKARNIKAYKMLAGNPKLAAQVRQRVMESVVASK